MALSTGAQTALAASNQPINLQAAGRFVHSWTRARLCLSVRFSRFRSNLTPRGKSCRFYSGLPTIAGRRNEAPGQQLVYSEMFLFVKPYPIYKRTKEKEARL
jgi:hypothetical protein